MDALDDETNVHSLPKISPIVSVGCCLVLSIVYVSSLYVWRNKQNRDHPATVKRRFCSVFFVMLIAPIFVYTFSNDELLKRTSFLNILGLRIEGLLAGIFVPFMLTAFLFLGPLCVQLCNGTLQIYFNIEYWKMCFGNILWIRNHVVAPLSEEFAFRACMMPLILQSFSPLASVFITPLFFGIAHLHHIAERLRSGIDIKTAIAISCFQLTYTTLFGFYSAYLFAKTGHFVAPFIAHAFCNHMGFGYLQDLWQQVKPKRLLLISCYVIGLIGWIYLLPIATNPDLYSNHLYWNTQKIS